VRRTTEGPIGLGTRHTALRAFMGRTLELSNEYTRYEPNRRVQDRRHGARASVLRRRTSRDGPRQAYVAETVTVVRGKVSAWSPDEGERILGPGETLSVPPNTKHGWRPVGDEGVRMLVEARPGARFEEMWRQFMGLLQDGKAGPKGPGFLQIMMMAHEFSDVMEMAGPPLFLQRCRCARHADRTAPRLQGSV